LQPITNSITKWAIRLGHVRIENVMDMQLVIIQNVFGTCSDKMDADHGIAIINSMLESG